MWLPSSPHVPLLEEGGKQAREQAQAWSARNGSAGSLRVGEGLYSCCVAVVTFLLLLLYIKNFKSCLKWPQSQLIDRAGIQVAGAVLGAAVFWGHASFAPPPYCFCPWCDSSSMEGLGPCPTLLTNRVEGLATWNLIRVTPKSLRSQQCVGWASSCIWGSQAASLYPWCPALAIGDADGAARQGDVYAKAEEMEEVRKGSAVSGKGGVERSGEGPSQDDRVSVSRERLDET